MLGVGYNSNNSNSDKSTTEDVKPTTIRARQLMRSTGTGAGVGCLLAGYSVFVAVARVFSEKGRGGNMCCDLCVVQDSQDFQIAPRFFR